MKLDCILGLVERTLTSLLMSLILGFISFSFFTGHFPPHKQDLFKAIKLGKQMFSDTSSLKKAEQDIQQAQAGGGPPNLEQMAEYQRMALKRTEVAIELLNIFKKFKLGAPDPELGLKLERVSNHLNEADREMNEILAQMRDGSEGQNSRH